MSFWRVTYLGAVFYCHIAKFLERSGFTGAIYQLNLYRLNSDLLGEHPLSLWIEMNPTHEKE